VKSVLYREVLLKLQDAVYRKCPGLLAWGVLFHHDNATPQTAWATQDRIQQVQWELLEHLPYSPDLAPSNFHFSGLLKKPTWWQTFCWWRRGWNENVKRLRQQSRLLCCRFRRTGKVMG
jgi:histone-lysine N-methyltransferase SETMAR